MPYHTTISIRTTNSGRATSTFHFRTPFNFTQVSVFSHSLYAFCGTIRKLYDARLGCTTPLARKHAHSGSSAYTYSTLFYDEDCARIHGIHGFLIGRVPRRLPVEKGRGGGRSITGLRRALTATRTPEQKSKFKKTYIASVIRLRVPRKQLCATVLVASCHFFIYVCVAPSLPLAGKYKK